MTLFFALKKPAILLQALHKLYINNGVELSLVVNDQLLYLYAFIGNYLYKINT